MLISDGPVKLRLRVAPLPWASVPVPVNAVPMVNTLLLVSVIPVTVTFGIARVPVVAWLLVSNV